jgi:hypothetical protein
MSKYQKDNFIMSNRYSILWVVAAITVWGLHASGLFYNAEVMENSDSLAPLYYIVPVVAIAAAVQGFKLLGTKTNTFK